MIRPTLKIVVLDFDGVLNSKVSAQRFGTYQKFGEENVAALNRILSQTGAKIVVSSTWRHGRTDQQLWSTLRENGVKGEVLGCVSRDLDKKDRGALVQEWLDDFRKGNHDEFSFRPPHNERVVFVILDDDDKQAPFCDRLVKTDPEVGLTDEDAGKAILMLKEVTW